HRNLLANAMQLRAWSRSVDCTESVLGVLPFFHAYGLSVCVLMSIAMGSTIHLYPRFETRPVLELLEGERINIVPAVPAMVAAFNRELKLQPDDLSFISVVISGTTECDMNVRATFSGYGVRKQLEADVLSVARLK